MSPEEARIPDRYGFDQFQVSQGDSVSAAILVAALMGMLGGGKITIDSHDWHAAIRRIGEGKLTIAVIRDPFRVTLEIKE